MKISINIQMTTPDGIVQDCEILSLEKGCDHIGEIGLSLDQGKEILKQIQQHVVSEQAEAYCSSHSECSTCGKKLRSKGRTAIRYRTPFGDIPVSSPRFYHCRCQQANAQTFSPLTKLLSEHVSPEMLWLETKWASLASYGASVALLIDVLPVAEQLNAETVRRHLAKIAKRIDDELEPEQDSYIQSSSYQRRNMAIPGGPIVVGIDGGDVRSREKGQTHFEVTVGKSMPTDQADRYIGLVQTFDDKPRRRLNEILKEQGWQENQSITFLTDGGESVVNMAREMAPASEHLLDWFHITMRLTVLGQYVKGLSKIDLEEGENLARQIRRIKGYLWNGNVHEGVAEINDLVDEIDCCEINYDSMKSLRKAAFEFQVYITNNAWMIPNYAERRRYGERVSTGFVESTVNTVVGKRFSKKQQMRWSKQGAHYMLQIRTRTLDGTLRTKFANWHPELRYENHNKVVA